MARGITASATLAAVFVTLSASAQTRAVGTLDEVLRKVGERVESYYARARSIICTETVRLQPMGADLIPEGFGREAVYELRVEWDGSTDPGKPPEARVVRDLRLGNGRPPKPTDQERRQLGCLQPPPISSEPLAFLLAERQNESVFSLAGRGKAIGRQAILLDYRPREPGTPALSYNGDCISVELPSRIRGRLWVDTENDDVLRYDEQLLSQVELKVPREQQRIGSPPYMTIERVDASTRYKPITFHDPDETVVLPETVVRTVWWRGSGTPRYRSTSTYSNYRRFITDVRIIQ